MEEVSSTPSLLGDEIGLSFLSAGDAVLTSAFETVFAVEGDDLAPFGLRAVASARGRVPAAVASMPGLQAVAAVMHMRNFLHLDPPGLALFVETGGAEGVVAAALAAELDNTRESWPFPAERLVCMVDPRSAGASDGAESGARALERLGATICASGFGGAVEGIGEGPRPDLICLDRAWFRRVSATPRAAPLLVPLTRGIRAAGMRTMIDDIGDASALWAAAEAGVDLVAGPLLSPALPAGIEPDQSPRPLGHFLADRQKVVPLRR